MPELQASLRRTKLWLLVSVIFLVVVIAVLIALPKNNLTYGATDRFVMTLVAILAALVGVVGFIIAWRRYR